jgi:hypothetical protein
MGHESFLRKEKIMKQTAILVFLILVPVSVFTSDLPIALQERGFATIGAGYQSWEQENGKPIQQIVTPISVFYPVNDQFFFNISNTPVSSTFDSLTMSGASDTWIKTTYVTENERMMFNVGLGVPTGKTRLSQEQFYLTRMLSEQALRYRVPVYGQGISVKAGVGIAHPINQNTITGFGINYIYKAPYELLNVDSTEFDPGNEINIIAGVNTKVGRKGTLSFDAVYTLYETDFFNGKELVDAGSKIILSASLMFPTKRGPLFAALKYRQRGKNQFYAYQNMAAYSKQSIGDQIDFNAYWQFHKWTQGSVAFMVDAREYSTNEDNVGGATLYGGGLRVQQALSLQTVLQVQAKYLTGTLFYTNEISISGFDVLARLFIYY